MKFLVFIKLSFSSSLQLEQVFRGVLMKILLSLGKLSIIETMNDDKNKFFELLDRALIKRDRSKPRTKAKKKSGGYTGKRTRQRKSEDASS